VLVVPAAYVLFAFLVLLRLMNSNPLFAWACPSKTTDGKELWLRVAKAGAARRAKTRADMNAKMVPYHANNGRRTPGARRTRVKHGAVRPKG
jgi:hypothetical protein